MTLLRPDLALIAEHVASGSRVLDVGCGDGALMAALRDQCGADARGLELDPENVAAAMARGLSVVQGDADTDLGYYQDDSFDYAILSQTLQTTKRPDLVIGHLLRIRSEEHTYELQSLRRSSYAVFCLKEKKDIHESSIST